MSSDQREAVLFRDDPRFNILLAKSVHKHPCLYDYTISEYTSKVSAEKAWLQVANEVKETISCCKTKWRNMRSVFVRKQRLKANIRGKPYYLNEHMKYLIPFLKGSPANPKQREDNVEDTTTRDSSSPPQTEFVVNEEIELEDAPEDDTGGDWTDGETNPLANKYVDIKQEVEESVPALTWSRRRKKSSKTQIREFVPGSSQSKKKNTSFSSCCEDEPRRMFLLSLVPEVDEFTETQMRSFKRRVLDLIDEVSEC